MSIDLIVSDPSSTSKDIVSHGLAVDIAKECAISLKELRDNIFKEECVGWCFAAIGKC